jgi:hypothetical protein
MVTKPNITAEDVYDLIAANKFQPLKQHDYDGLGGCSFKARICEHEGCTVILDFEDGLVVALIDSDGNEFYVDMISQQVRAQ